MDLLTRSTSISYLRKIVIEVVILKLEFEFSIIEFFILGYIAQKIGRRVYTRDRETRPGPVLSLTLERAPLQSFQESKYPRV